jgi:hypothetical protein
MAWKKITSQQCLERLMACVDWSHSFVREVYLISPSYIVRDGNSRGWTAQADALPSVRLLITSPSESCPAVELLFTEVDEFGIWFGAGELSPSAKWTEAGIAWSFHTQLGSTIRAGSLCYRLLDESAWGNDLRYGWGASDDP